MSCDRVTYKQSKFGNSDPLALPLVASRSPTAITHHDYLRTPQPSLPHCEIDSCDNASELRLSCSCSCLCCIRGPNFEWFMHLVSLKIDAILFCSPFRPPRQRECKLPVERLHRKLFYVALDQTRLEYISPPTGLKFVTSKIYRLLTGFRIPSDCSVADKLLVNNVSFSTRPSYILLHKYTGKIAQVHAKYYLSPSIRKQQ
ncbi:hypothetical protein LENED_005481 [Lentinula edodes]|uniref:Uncharacterized protein n=1 Tax=Lentinula edodes TaxID=5353 RepID=A0A1Q3E926_LENED|nr:hypothetical protein LENED_005481 [Lentinula edodes]